MSDEKLINLDHLKKISGNNNDFIREILGVFIANTPNDLEQMRQHYHGNNLEQTQYFAHKLKSSTDAIGFKKGRVIFQQIEDAIRERRDLDRIPQLIDQASTACLKATNAAQIKLNKDL